MGKLGVRQFLLGAGVAGFLSWGLLGGLYFLVEAANNILLFSIFLVLGMISAVSLLLYKYYPALKSKFPENALAGISFLIALILILIVVILDTYVIFNYPVQKNFEEQLIQKQPTEAVKQNYGELEEKLRQFRAQYDIDGGSLEVWSEIDGELKNKLELSTEEREAVIKLKIHENIELKQVSSLYDTKPVGYLDQNRFLNGALELETRLAPLALLNLLKQIEDELGRERSRKWGPRIIDLDMLLYDKRCLDTERLKLPHPEMLTRAFVLIPLTELAPDREVKGKTLQAYVQELKIEKEDIIKAGKLELS